MALTKTYDLPRAERISRNVGIVTGKISFDSSYPTGGESLDLTDRLRTVLAVFIENKSGYIFEYDYTNKKVKAYYPTKSQSSNLAGTVTVTSNTGDGDAGTYNVSFSGEKGEVDAGPGEEVADTTDLSSVTNVRFVAYGLI